MIASNWFARLVYFFQFLIFIKLTLGLSEITHEVVFDINTDTLAFVHIQVRIFLILQL